MVVTRTPTGISNEHLFHGTDAVVYVEGGSARDNAASLDLLFWRTMFQRFAGARRVTFKARGGKSTLLAIADGIVDGSILATVVCMDRDHDHAYGRLRLAPSILYTWGYSWENDIWSAKAIEEVFYVLCGVDRTAVDVGPQIRAAMEGFERAVRWATYADLLTAGVGHSAIPRDSFRCVIPPDRGWPSLDRRFLYGCVRAARQDTRGSTRKRPAGTDFDVMRDVYGHLLNHFCHRILAHLLRGHGCHTISKDHACAFVIDISARWMRAEIASYHQSVFAVLPM